MTRREWIGMGGIGLIAAVAAGRFVWSGEESGWPGMQASPGVFPVTRTAAQWRQQLAPPVYRILRESGTETPYTSPLLNEHRAGTFACAGCANALFDAAVKYDSKTGWPSFWQPLPGAVIERPDNAFGVSRTEVLCADCGGHLGHVFRDGPPPTGLRYCMNGLALTFTPARARG